jgi:mono/diheme cytochrome c family protein
MLRALVVAGIATAYTSLALAAGNAEVGHLLSQRWCSACHLVPGASTASDVAPSFITVAKTHKNDPSWVRAWLMTPHPPMQGINLTRQQIDDVTAYLQSLSAADR